MRLPYPALRGAAAGNIVAAVGCRHKADAADGILPVRTTADKCGRGGDNDARMPA